MTTFPKRLFSYSVAGVLTAFGAQAAYLGCYFNDVLTRYCMLPLFYVAFWPNDLVYTLFYAKRLGGPESGNLRSACLTSVTGWLVLATVAAVVHHYLALQRQRGLQPSPVMMTHGG